MKSQNVAVLVVLVVVALASAFAMPKKLELFKPTPSHYHDYTFNYQGGAPFCSQCGGKGQYACSNQPNWVKSQLFVDNQHSGFSVLRVEAILTGSYGCTSPVFSTVVQVTLNGVALNTLNLDGDQQCKCNTCDGQVSFAKDTPLGFPGYFTDGKAKNNVTINVFTGSICLNTLTVRVTYGSPTYPLSTYYFTQPFSASRDISNGICGIRSADYSSGQIAFNDPLPAGSVIYSIDVEVYGAYFYNTNSGLCSNATASLAINNFQIGDQLSLYYPRQFNNTNVVNSPCHNYGCDGKWLFSLQQLYQNGLPNWNYGQQNRLSFNANSSPYFAWAAFYLYYLPKSSVVIA